MCILPTCHTAVKSKRQGMLFHVWQHGHVFNNQASFRLNQSSHNNWFRRHVPSGGGKKLQSGNYLNNDSTYCSSKLGLSNNFTYVGSYQEAVQHCGPQTRANHRLWRPHRLTAQLDGRRLATHHGFPRCAWAVWALPQTEFGCLSRGSKTDARQQGLRTTRLPLIVCSKYKPALSSNVLPLKAADTHPCVGKALTSHNCTLT
jgi:hypothetical protein